MEKALAYLSSADPILAQLISDYSQPSFQPHTNYYHELVSSIISQQLSVKAASTIEKRFKGLFGDSFPDPEQIVQTDVEQLRSAGLSRPKAGYIQDLATKIINRMIVFDSLDTLSNQEVITELTKVKGIGEWTVHMFLMFCMGRSDILPTGDLGIRNGVRLLYDFDHTPTPEEVTTVAQQNNWHPYESTASWYVWQSLDNVPKD